MPILSVLIPVYNAENFIKKCIDSVLAQTFKDFEVVCLDDGSKDTSGIILDDYASQDLRLRVIHTENGGIAKGRTRLLYEAQGKFVYFMDSDDWLDYDFFEKAFQGIEDDDEVILFDVYRDNGNKCKIKKVFNSNNVTLFKDLNSREAFEIFYMKCYRTVWNKFVSRDLLVSNNVEFIDLFCADDVLYTLTVYSLADKYKYIPIAGYHYYYNSKSISQKYQGDKVIWMMENLYYEQHKLKNRFKTFDLIPYINTSLVNSLPMIANQYVFHKNLDMSIRDKKQLMTTILEKKPFKDALENYEYRLLGKSAKLIMINGKPNITAIRLMCKLKKLV